jgi:hypothetical protein
MIKVNELRIGNLIFEKGVNDNDASEIIVIDIIMLWQVHDKPEYFEPIPLTPELLEACGFVSFKTNPELTLTISSDESDSLNLTCFDKKANELSIYIEKTGRDDDWNSQYTSTFTPVFFLHQLQNLYFALTGEELTVNIKADTKPTTQQ